MAKNINRKVTIYINGKEVENTMKGLRAELKRLVLMGVQSAFQVIDIGVGKLTNIYEGFSDTLEGKNLEEKMLAIGSAVNRFKIVMEILPWEAKIDIYGNLRLLVKCF